MVILRQFLAIFCQLYKHLLQNWDLDSHFEGLYKSKSFIWLAKKWMEMVVKRPFTSQFWIETIYTWFRPAFVCFLWHFKSHRVVRVSSWEWHNGHLTQVFWPCQWNLIKTFQAEANASLITKMALKKNLNIFRRSYRPTKLQNSDFQSHFSMSIIIWIFLKKILFENINLGARLL